MSQKYSNVDRYKATPDQMIAMMSDPDYLKSKYEALGDISFEVVEQEVSDDALVLKVDRTMESNLPSVAKKVMGEKSRLVQTENWSTDGATKTASVTIETPGAPVKITAEFKLDPVGDAESDYTASFEIKASVPFVGGKIEKSVVEETQKSLVAELAFNSKWLADHP